MNVDHFRAPWLVTFQQKRFCNVNYYGHNISDNNELQPGRSDVGYVFHKSTNVSIRPLLLSSLSSFIACNLTYQQINELKKIVFSLRLLEVIRRLIFTIQLIFFFCNNVINLFKTNFINFVILFINNELNWPQVYLTYKMTN